MTREHIINILCVIYFDSGREVMGGNCFNQELQVIMDAARLCQHSHCVESLSFALLFIELIVYFPSKLNSLSFFLLFSVFRKLSELLSATWTISSPSLAPTSSSSLVSCTATDPLLYWW